MTSLSIDRVELRKKAEAATPGPWRASVTEPPGQWCLHAPSSPWQMLTAWQEHGFPAEANASYIAAANPTTILQLLNDKDKLLDEVERLRAALDAVEPKVKALEWHGDAAFSLAGRYIVSIWHTVHDAWKWQDVTGRWHTGDGKLTKAQAQAAAQADYEARIKSALQPQEGTP